MNLRVARKIVHRIGTPSGDRYSHAQKDMAILVFDRAFRREMKPFHQFIRVLAKVMEADACTASK